MTKTSIIQIIVGVIVLVLIGTAIVSGTKNKTENGAYSNSSNPTVEVTGTTSTTNAPSSATTNTDMNTTSNAGAKPAITVGDVKTDAGVEAKVVSVYKLTDVAKHSTEASCWSAVNGSVYDLTAWIAAHPGGERAILGICGKDGSSSFNRKHGNSANAKDELADFKIGVLTN